MIKLSISSILHFAGVFLLLLTTAAIGQEVEWSRSIDAGDAAMGKQEYAEAENYYRQALATAEKHWKKDARISVALIKVAESCNAQKKHEEAETLAERSLAALAEALKAHKPRNATDELEQVDVSATLYDRAGNLFARNHKYQQAEAAYQQVVTIREKYVSNASPTKPNNEAFLRFLAQNLSNSQDKLADANSKLARLYCTEQKLQDAESFFKKAIVLKEKQYGADQPQVTESLTELATCYSQQSAYAKAEPLYTRVIAILEQSRFKDKAPMAVALDNYALLLRKTSREAEAKPFLERANAIRAKSEITKQ